MNHKICCLYHMTLMEDLFDSVVYPVYTEQIWGGQTYPHRQHCGKKCFRLSSSLQDRSTVFVLEDVMIRVTTNDDGIVFYDVVAHHITSPIVLRTIKHFQLFTDTNYFMNSYCLDQKKKDLDEKEKQLQLERQELNDRMEMNKRLSFLS